MCTDNEEKLAAKYLDKAEKYFESLFLAGHIDDILYTKERQRVFANKQEEEEYTLQEFMRNSEKTGPDDLDESDIIYFHTFDVLRKVMTAEDQDKLTDAVVDQLERQLLFVKMFAELYRIIMEDYARPAWENRGHSRYSYDVYDRILSELNKSGVITALREDASFWEFYQTVSYAAWRKAAYYIANHIKVPATQDTDEPGVRYRTLAMHFEEDVSGKKRKWT